jgi:hypothetical protein
VRTRHSANGVERAPLTLYGESRAPGDRLLPDGGTECDLVHVDQVLAQRFEIHLRPIRTRVGFQQPNDLRDRAEGVLTG